MSLRNHAKIVGIHFQDTRNLKGPPTPGNPNYCSSTCKPQLNPQDSTNVMCVDRKTNNPSDLCPGFMCLGSKCRFGH